MGSFRSVLPAFLFFLFLGGGALLGGCSFAPAGADDEREKLAKMGEPYEKPIEQRTVPELPAAASWQEVLRRAFLANAGLEAAYFEWQAAVERNGIASAWPNSRVMLGYSFAFGPGSMKAFDRMTFAAGIDTMQNLSFPAKVAAAGQVALDEARAAGERFRAAKFQLQERVLSAWADYALLAERGRIQREHLQLASLTLDTARSRVQAGGPQDDLLRAEVAHRTAADALAVVEAESQAARSMLNGLLARDADAALDPPRTLPAPRPIAVDDAALLAAAVDQNPELAPLARQVEGRTDALARARLEWLPDIDPSLMFTGSLVQVVGASIMLPTTIRQIEGGIREAEAMLKASAAMLRQGRRDRGATFVATLVTLRDAERQAEVFATITAV